MFDGNLTDASLPHRRNADAPMLVQLFEKPSDDNEEQSANAFSSTVFDCIDALFKAEQPSQIEAPIWTTPEGIVIEVNAVQPLNAFASMVFMEFGILTDCNFVHPENADSQMTFTFVVPFDPIIVALVMPGGHKYSWSQANPSK